VEICATQLHISSYMEIYVQLSYTYIGVMPHSKNKSKTLNYKIMISKKTKLLRQKEGDLSSLNAALKEKDISISELQRGNKIKNKLGNTSIKKIESLIKYLNCKRQIILERLVNKPVYKFLDLAPEENGKGYETYYNALNWAFQNNKIKNLALTGPYGSGKTSILCSFEKIYPNYNFLWISLASFNDKETTTEYTIEKLAKELTENPTKETIEKLAKIIAENKIKNKNQESKNDSNEKLTEKEILEQKIELSIFQQLFYHEKNSDVPDSRFKRINNIRKSTILTKAIVLVIWFFSIVVLFKINIIKGTIFWNFLYQFGYWILNIASLGVYHKLIFISISLFIFIIATFWGIIKIIRIANNSNINKLKIQNSEIEINPKVNISILNKYLDEILYFFEVTDSKVVVIEDLDRFNNHEIFIKLRELNSLINKSRQVNKKIVFLYAIKDDMFMNNEDRTKFFDYMIPVIPVINSSNSGELFKEYLKDELKSVDLPYGLSTSFIVEVSKFVEDMRLLKSVCNEYFIYKDRLRSEEDNLEKDKLFSMILYKNMYPNDFVQLHSNKGLIYDTFKKKPAYIKSLVDDLVNEIKLINHEINKLNSLQIININELRSIYINEIRNQINNPLSLQINDTHVEFKDVIEDISFNSLTEISNIKYYTLTFHSTWSGNTNKYTKEVLESNISFKTIEEIVDIDFSYYEREKLIIDKANNKINELKQEIEIVKSKKNKIQNKSLHELSKLYEIDSQLPNEKLLKYLLSNGLINENYHYYISYFYEGSLTRADNDFLLNVISHTQTNYDYELKEIENLSNTIDIRYYDTYPILNYNLVDFLLINSRDVYLKPIFQTLLNSESNKAIDFIDGYIDNGINKDIFIKELTSSWLGFWKYFEQKTMFSDDRLNIYLKLIIQYAKIEDVKKQYLSNFITINRDFLSLFTFGDGLEKVKLVLKELDIKFKELEYNSDAIDLLQFIYENDLYEINTYNVAFFAQNIDSAKSDDLKNANYTTIQQTKSVFLREYIEINIENYISSVFLKLTDNTHESELVIIKLLNHSNISNKNKEKIIQKEEFILRDLSEIDDLEVQKYLFQYNKVQIIWDNIIVYFDIINSENEVKELDDTLITYLNDEKNYESLVADEYESLNSIDEFIETFIV